MTILLRWVCLLMLTTSSLHCHAFALVTTPGCLLRAFSPILPSTLATRHNKVLSIQMKDEASPQKKWKKRALSVIVAGFMSSPLVVKPKCTLAFTASTQAERIMEPPSVMVVQNWRYSEFLTAVEDKRVVRVTFSPDCKRILAIDVKGRRFKLDALPDDPELISTLIDHKVDVHILSPEQGSGIGALARSMIFPFLVVGCLLLLTRGPPRGNTPWGGPGMGPMDLTRSGAKMQMLPNTGVTFNDVVGVDGAKTELQEIVEFLKNPDRFTQLGARIPRGLILEGSPGTGKTLLARAVAGEAAVPFFSIAGSQFVEMFVGVGASRVRDLFNQAKMNAPCIIFIDEIDAVGRQRGAGIAGGNDEREQTLNQILAEMDGFEGNPGIIVIAATNRADVLDTALLRPGRFDRRIYVDLPDFQGRVAILGVHSRGKPLEAEVDMEQIARRCPGFSGASIANLMNEAAIFAARKNKATIGNEEISDALDRVMMGPEKKTAQSTIQKRELVAYHEAGHALVGALIPDYDQVVKVTITPRGGAGGLTFFAPNEDRVDNGLYSRQFLESQMAVALGGRLAEELVFGEEEVTTGASNDLQQVTSTARLMVTRFGMSERVGPVCLADDNQSPFLGRQMGLPQSKLSSESRALVDQEISRLVSQAYNKAKQMLVDNRECLDKLAQLLVAQETVTAEELGALLAMSDVKMGSYGVYGPD